MKEIPLKNSDKTFLVDDEDFEKFSQFEWKLASSGYPYIMMTAHKFLLGNQEKGKVIDHLNRDKLDNRKENLRICTQLENVQNRSKKTGCTSKYRGVSWDKKKNKWALQAFYNGKMLYYGYFDSEEEAAKAYDMAIFATVDGHCYLNFPENNYHKDDFLNFLIEIDRKVQSRFYSNITGVTFHKRSNKWAVRNTKPGQRKTYGQFNTKEEAEKFAIEIIPQKEPIYAIKILKELQEKRKNEN